MSEGRKRLWPEDEAQNLAEYALLLFMICMIGVAVMKGFASSVSNMYSWASNRVIAVTVNEPSASSISTASTSIHVTSPRQKVSGKTLSNTVLVHTKR